MKVQRILAAALLLSALASGCASKKERLTLEFHAMGGVPIHVTAWDVTEADFQELVEAYRLEVQRLESLMSTHRASSVLSQANRAKGGAAVHLDEHTAAVVADALRHARLTDGAFDPTVGPLIQLWKEAAKAGRPPGPGALARARQRVGHARVRLTQPPSGQRTLHLEPGTALDLGGIAKGYFADVGARWLRKNGVQRALVELGGDLMAFDDRPDSVRQPFRVGVRHPFTKGELLGVLQLDGGAVVTSGDYERGFTIGDRRYNHILDPRTGQPAEGVHAVTLTAPDAMAADALATGVLVLGETAGLALVERLPGVEALFVVDDPHAPGGWRIVPSSGIGKRFRRKK